MSIEIRTEGYTATCDSCGRPWRAYECLPTEPAIRVALASVDDWDVDGTETCCPRCCGERLLDKRLTDMRSALENITATAREVKRKNAPEFMEWLAQRIDEATKAWKGVKS